MPRRGRVIPTPKSSVALICATAALGVPAAAEARSSYCAKKRAYCTSVKKRAGDVELRIKTSRFRGRYILCVKAPAKEQYDDPFSRGICKRFRLRKRRRGVYSSTVRWKRSFPNEGSGVYRVRWRRSGKNLGPVLSFRR